MAGMTGSVIHQSINQKELHFGKVQLEFKEQLSRGLSLYKKVAKNLQINFNYNGRKSEETNAIHSGGMELRAFF